MPRANKFGFIAAYAVTLVGLAVLFAASARAGWDMNAAIDNTNFVVNAGCSGTLIDAKERYVLTANHCVADQYKTIDRENVDDDGIVTKEKVRKLIDGTVSQLDFSGSEMTRTVTYRVRLVAIDDKRDLAVVQIVSPLPEGKTASRIACTAPLRGDKVFIVGNPMGTLYSSVVEGIVSSMQRDYGFIDFPSKDDKAPLMQVSGGIVGGNSGGAVYNDHGQIIGVSVLGHRVNEVLGFAAPLDSIKGFLKDNSKLSSVMSYCEPPKGDDAKAAEAKPEPKAKKKKKKKADDDADAD